MNTMRLLNLQRILWPVARLDHQRTGGRVPDAPRDVLHSAGESVYRQTIIGKS